MIPAETGERPRGGATEPVGPAGRTKYAPLIDGNAAKQALLREGGEVEDLLAGEPRSLIPDLLDAAEDQEPGSMTMCDSAARQNADELVVTISAEARDALHSQAMDLLSGIGVRRAEIDPAFSEDLRGLLETLGGEGRAAVDLMIPSEELRRVMQE